MDGWTTFGMWSNVVIYNVLFLKLKFWMVELHLACDIMFFFYWIVELQFTCEVMLWYNVFVFKTQVLDGWTTFGMWSNVVL